MALPAVAIAAGDPAGIGPEIALKAALDPEVRRICAPIVFGDRATLRIHASACGLTSQVDSISLVDCAKLAPGELQIGQIAAAHGRAAIQSAEAAIRAALAGEVAAVVAAPHTEAAIHAAGVEFDGYPSFVARVTGLAPEDGVLMLCFEHRGREVRIAHVTLHASVATALRLITRERVTRTIRAVAQALVRLGLVTPRILVSGVNPHAGEGGLFGREEHDIVSPAIEQARRDGFSVDGPIGADTLLQRADHDAYVVMLHDQGHIAAKLLAPHRVAGLTIGTPVLFSSVAHGSALDIAGQGRAEHYAMVEAIARLVGRPGRSAAA